MGLEQFCVGVVMCLIVFIMASIFGAVGTCICDDKFGSFTSFVIVCVGLGICITYILYERGILI